MSEFTPFENGAEEFHHANGFNGVERVNHAPVKVLDINHEHLYPTAEIRRHNPDLIELVSWRVLELEGLEEDMDGYNPCACDGVRLHEDSDELMDVVLVRTEKSEGDYDAYVRICQLDANGRLVEIDGVPRLHGEDPMIVSQPDGSVYITVVEVDWEGSGSKRVCKSYHTALYYGQSIDTLRLIARLPGKANRMVVLPDEDALDGELDGADEDDTHKVVLYIRPQGKIKVLNDEGVLVDEDNALGRAKYIVLDAAMRKRLETEHEMHGNIDGFAMWVMREAKYVGKSGIYKDWGALNGGEHVGGGWVLSADHAASRAYAVGADPYDKFIYFDNGDVALDMSGYARETKHYLGYIKFHHPETNRGFILGVNARIEHFEGLEGAAKAEVLELFSSEGGVGGVIYPGSVDRVEAHADGSVTFRQLLGIGDVKMVEAWFRIPARVFESLDHEAADEIRRALFERHEAFLQRRRGVLAEHAIGVSIMAEYSEAS